MRCVLLLLLLMNFVSAAVSPLQLVIKTTADNESFTLGLIPGEAYNATVDWGDGSTTPMVMATFTTETNPAHTYAAAGTYTVSITGTDINGCPGVQLYDGDSQKVYELKQWGGHIWKTMFYAFGGCSNMTITATDHTTARTENVTSFSSAFYSCSSLTSFPLIDTSKGENFSEAWYDCHSLTSFPAINTSKGKQFQYAWGLCRGLTSFPLIDTGLGSRFENTWSECSGIQNFPSLNFNKMSDGTECFKGVTVPTATYTAMLIDLAANNVREDVVFDGGNSRYSGTAITARDTTLKAGRNWDITDGELATPLITSRIAASGRTGVDFSYQITASDGPITGFAAVNLPAGLTVDAMSGIISGKPLPAAVGVTTVTLTATNDLGIGPEKPLTLAITDNDQAPVITSAGIATVVQGTALTYQIVATKSPTGYAAVGSLSDNGLSLDATTGVISGTPTTVGTMEIVLQASNASGTGLKLLTISTTNINTPVITSATSVTAVKGSAFSYQIAASKSPASYAVVGLPANGLSINAATGEISGTPISLGTMEVVLKASNASGTGMAPLTITTVESTGGGGGSGASSDGGICGIGSGAAALILLAFFNCAWMSWRRLGGRDIAPR
jgi:Putative Ig domain/PKD domain